MKALVLGLGQSGRGAVNLLKKLNYQVFGFDDNKSRVAIGGLNIVSRGNLEQIIRAVDLIVASPGVFFGHQVFKLAKKYKKKVMGELELGFENFKGKIVAVTGTDGKTTTVNLIDSILKEARRTHLTAGNVGLSFCQALIRSKSKLAVLEVSSFQARDIEKFRPPIGVFLNFSKDHLVRLGNLTFHRSEREYFENKERIFKNQTKDDFLILKFNDPMVKKTKSKAKKLYFYLRPLPKGFEGMFLSNSWFYLRRGRLNKRLFNLSRVKLLGEHNLENIMAASLTALLLGVGSKTIAKAISGVKKFEHRIEFIRKIKGIEFYNDSKSTTAQAIAAALKALMPKGRGILIAGGLDKGGNFEVLRFLIRKVLANAVLIGKDKSKIKKAWQGALPIHFEKNLKAAVKKAYKLALNNGSKWVLLSPGCASFDMFKNYKDRGKRFKSLVRQLEK